MAVRPSRADQLRAYEQTMGDDALGRQLRAGASKCRTCRAPIRWAKTSNGRRMPLDYDPHEGGNVLLFADGSCAVVEAGGETSGTRPGYGAFTRHYSHFATCPDASSHRRAEN